MPRKKRESELRAFRELRGEYSEQDIAECFERVQREGMPGGQPCHSPMAFLSHGVADVLAVVREQREKEQRRQQREQEAAESARQEHAEAERDRRLSAIREAAFGRSFPDPDRQREALVELCRGTPFRADGQAGYVFGVGRWWNGLNQSEKAALLDALEVAQGDDRLLLVDLGAGGVVS